MRLATERARLPRAALAFLVALITAPTACGRASKSDAATVRGRVVDSDGHALEGARVMLLVGGRAGEPLVERASIADGRFTLPGVPAGHYLLRAEATGFSAAGVTLALEARETVTTVLRLDPEQRLTGMVQDRGGRPLGQAALFAWPQGGGRVGVVEAATGSDGRFALGLAPGVWTLMVEAPGFGTLRLERVNVPGRALVLRLEGEARSLGGMVVGGPGASAAAAAGASVRLGGNTLPAPREARTDAKGLYLFHGLGLGRFVLRSSQGTRASAPRSVEIDERTGWLPPVRLELAPGGSIAGKVVDDRGQALAGAEVELASAPADELPEIAKTDGQGRFAAGPFAPGRYRAWARLPGHAAASVPQVIVKAGATAAIELRLLRGAELRGLVLTEQGGQPVTGATVTVSAIDTGVHELAVLPGSLPPAAEAANLPVQSLRRPAQLRSATTDRQGRFHVTELSPGRVRIDVVAPGLLPLRKDGIVLQPGRVDDLGRLGLASGVTVNGRTVDEAGAPVGDARIEARSLGGRGAAFFAAAGEDGTFTLQVPVGRWRLVAHAPRRAPATREPLEVVAGRPPAPVELRLVAAEASLEGTVRDPAGRPVVAATVSAYALRAGSADASAPAPADGVPIAAARTDGKGRFRLHGVPAVPLYLEARHPDWPVPAAVVKPGEAVALQAARPGGVEGDVRDGSSGAFINSYRLQALGPGGSLPGGMRTLGAGFELRGLAPGRWRLKVEADGYGVGEQELEVPAAAARNELSLHDVRVELLRPGAQARPHDAGPTAGQ
jgi:protocatechuate 3,4-dioxygenase beta subunit